MNLKHQVFILCFLLVCSAHIGKAQEQPESPLVGSYQEYVAHKESTQFNLNWISLGPVLNSARVEAVQAHPSDPNTIYAAFGSGNLWKTVNGGLSWKPIFNDMPAQGIGDIALAPSNPDIIYVGTGESLKKPRNFTFPGTGIYRSDNGGDTWKHLGLNDSWHIGEIAVHPENPDIVVVAVLGHFWSTNENRGIYRTDDGGKSWAQVFHIDEKTGANDVVFAPSNPSVVYASMWENNPGINGKNSAVYKSIDTGETWEKASSGIPETENTGRIGLAVSYQNENKVYAFLDHRNKEIPIEAAEVYRTLDGGMSWAKTHKEPLKFLSVIGWYFVDIYTNPKDDEEIFALGVRLGHSTDGGASFKFIEGNIKHLNESPAQTLHLDHCEMWVNPANPNHLVLGNDGGVFISIDKGENWLHYNNIPTGEFYDITIDNRTPYRIYGGTQDDSNVYGPGVKWNEGEDDAWEYLWIDAWSGGDGCQTYVDSENPDIVYYSAQNGAVRQMNLKTGKSWSIRPKQLNKEGFATNFITPYLLSKHDNDVLYLAGSQVLKTSNQGKKWDIISPDITKSVDRDKRSTAAGAFAESTLNPNILYVGTDKGGFWATEDGGKKWDEYSTDLSSNYIRSISPSFHNESRVYITQTGINYDDLNSYVFMSNDHGKNWKSIKSNLPNEVANVILEDPNFDQILYVGTLRGVYISTNQGASWQLLGSNLPAVSVADLEIDSESKDLVIATHGRGIYKINLSPVYSFFENQNKEGLYDVPDLVRPKYRHSHRDVDKQSVNEIPISFYVTKAMDISLEITDSMDSLIWRQSISAEPGINQFTWNGVTKRNESDHPYFVHYKEFIPEGEYTLLFKSEGIVDRKSLLVKDPE